MGWFPIYYHGGSWSSKAWRLWRESVGHGRKSQNTYARNEELLSTIHHVYTWTSGCQMDRNSDTFFSQLTKGLNTSHWRVLVFSPGSPQLRGLVQRCGSRFRRGNPQRASLCEKVGRDVLAKGNWQPSSRVVNCRWQSGWPFGSAKLGTLCHCGSSVEP